MNRMISIWFFIGALMTVYGALILGAGLQALHAPVAADAFVAHLHLQLWWGMGMLALGIVYLVVFRPGRKKKPAPGGD
jgi:membrane protein implicated in regulation of membrane protease activity